MPKKIFQSAKQMWRVFIFQVGEPSKQYVKDVEEIIAVRNEIVHGAPIVKTAEELMGLAMQLRQVTPHEMRNEHEQASSERETSKRASNDVSCFSHHFILFSHLTHQKGKRPGQHPISRTGPGKGEGPCASAVTDTTKLPGRLPRRDQDLLCRAELAGEPYYVGQGRRNTTQLDAHLWALSPGRIAAQPLGPPQTPMRPLRA